jgi:hypothetical protein
MAALNDGISVASGVSMNDTIVDWLNNLRSVLSSSIPIYVTSGIRTASAQGSAMYSKYVSAGEGSSGWQALYDTYSDDSIIDDIKDDITGWTGLSDPTESGFQSALASIESRGLLDNLTDHAKGDALDIRTVDLSSSQIRSLISAAESLGARTLYETYPPHLHVDGLALGALGKIPLVGVAWAKTKAVAAATPTWAIWVVAIAGIFGGGGAIWWASQGD